MDWLTPRQKCHELRNYSAACLIALACNRPTVLPFITVCNSMFAVTTRLASLAFCQKLKLSPAHERMKATLMDFYTRGNHHMAGYKQALQSCCCPALPGMSEHSPVYVVKARLTHGSAFHPGSRAGMWVRTI